MDRERMQAFIADKLAVDGALDLVEGDTHGLVMWHHRQGAETVWVVHRWATERTDGSPVAGGIMFWSGGYYWKREQAMVDYWERSGMVTA